ncbi:hypothetical protein [Dyadobacter sp. Leaf189]|uniref:hypothetical protein n=1 Tax=Dyadobacter sp. Leaf189 TaxID=1736295 RepID=UPI0006F6BAA7|nr:hypothetical protein [Dyadobacter sp. Leaf189]KQS33979.1 hypothetical protein ASG33_08080 [Dyadobacter sp. Leaf189]
MKKLLSLWLFAILPLCALSQKIQVSGTVDLSNYYTKAQTDSIISKLAMKPTDPAGPVTNPPVGLPVCKRGPRPDRVFNITSTHADVLWDGDEVFGWDYSIYRGTERVAFGSVKPVSNTEQITYAGLRPGTYTLSLSGNTCRSDVYSIPFDVPDVNSGTGGGVSPPPVGITGKKHIYMGLTGYGWNENDPDGLSPEWKESIESFLNLEYNGTRFKGIDGIRVNIKWFEYEPTKGKFNDGILKRIANYCNARGLILNVAFLPYRREFEIVNGKKVYDTMIPDDHKATLASGKRWYAEGSIQELTTYLTYCPSMHSKVAQFEFKRAAKHMAQFLKANCNADYMATVTALTEEFQLVHDESPTITTGYSNADLEAWRSYSGGQPPVYQPLVWGEPDERGNRKVISTDIWEFADILKSPVGKLWGDFQTQGLRDFHTAFVQGVREGGMRSSTMYAGVGAPSGVFNFSTKLDKIFSAGSADQPDIIYSSEGDAGSQDSKLMATDLNIGTFSGSDTAIEFDPDDISASQQRNPPLETDLNGNILYTFGRSFFIRGGDIIHFAMKYYPPKIHQLSEALFKLRTEFLDSNSGMTGIEQGSPVVHTVTEYGMQEFRWKWSNSGGGLTKQVKIILK